MIADRIVGESMTLGVAHAVGRESCGHHVACRVGGRDRTECSRVGHEGASVSKVRPVAAAACDVVPLLVWHVLGFLKPNRRSNSVRRNSAGAGDIEATNWRSRGGVRAALWWYSNSRFHGPRKLTLTETAKKAWVHQLKGQVEKQGSDRASWYVSWTDPAGKQLRKSCGPGKVGKSSANKLADSIHSQLVCGTYEAKERRTWADFRKDYEAKIAARFDVLSRTAARQSLDAFERVAKPKLVAAITADVVDTHVFPWNQDRRQLWPEFHRIQESATLADGSPLPKGGKNGFYGFHDLRRGFATMNAA